MAKVLVVYYSRSGHTKAMAEEVAKGAEEAGAEVDLRSVEDASVDDLPGYDAVIAGSPTYYGHMAWEMKRFLDESVRYHGDLAGKVGGAFSSAGGHGGGYETTIRGILDALLIHGMIVQGTASGPHYGPVAAGAPDERAKKECRLLGKRVAELAARLMGR
jgi:NAD(P)H dehydrogenase (quinone)